MSIQITAYRKKGNEDCPSHVRTASIPNAISSLVRFELGYGGDIKEISEGKIVTETRIMGCLDTTVFEGSAEDMKPLLEAVYYFVSSKEHDNDYITRVVGELKKCNTLILTQLGPILLGKYRVKGAIALALGYPKERISALADHSNNDFYAALDLLSSGDVSSMEEAVALI